jgi:hypothetical protein
MHQSDILANPQLRQTSPSRPTPSKEYNESQLLPVWLRLPKPGERCPITSLTRSALNELILGPDPRVESVVLRKKGARRGIRLIRTVDLIAYLDTEAKRQSQATPIGEDRRESRSSPSSSNDTTSGVDRQSEAGSCNGSTEFEV